MTAMMKSSRKILAMKKNITFRSSTSKPKLQFRSVKSKADWSDEMGMCVTAGIIPKDRSYCSIEESL
ncbi:hypothetical protein QN277_013351 [Acacia crassicarpa]|uniref:Uncharacterized protein n=1 Tax=Acacia crassicarpa TaxID=499986 RepID=A0AAE1N310_9FABA|nr:hypothetical protein QN277_013351 [Acacia crassicarpa]